MSLKHFILGVLADEPLSGYDIHQRFEANINHFWTTTQTQIYRTLHALHDLGWLTMEVVEQDDNPNKKVYHLTPEGRAELRHWLATPVEDVMRAPLAGRIYFGAHADLDALIAALEAYSLGTCQHISALEGVQAAVPSLDVLERIDHQQLFELLSLDYGVHILHTEVAWLEEWIMRLRQLAARRAAASDAPP